MPTTSLDRLLFAQGGRCFFCEEPLPRADASVEHLVAVANGGSNHDGNCVACCKTINALLGSLSLKEKLRVVLNQRGPFRCPNADPPPADLPGGLPLDVALANLRASGPAKPRSPKALRNVLATLFPKATPSMIESLMAGLMTSGRLSESDGKVVYPF